MVVDGGRLRAFDSIANLNASGITLFDYYRRSLAREETCMR
jgi:hypothetical protein